jgi:hypothetical protein
MPRTIDDLVQAPTPLPPTQTFGTPYAPMPTMMTPSQAWQSAMPKPDPFTQQALQTPSIPRSGLAQTQLFMDPNAARQAIAYRGAERMGQAISNVGNYASWMPGVNLFGMGMSLGGQFLNNIPGLGGLARGAYNAFSGPSEQALGQLQNMAQLQRMTAGNLNLSQGMGLGGTGLDPMAALSLSKRLTGIGQQTNVAAGREKDEGITTQDMMRFTQTAAQTGLLDAATNIDQITGTVQKLMKVVGKMAKLTGDPDFRSNLESIAEMRRFGFTVDQAVQATRDIQTFARQAGVGVGQMVSGGGAVGMQAFQQHGMAGGVGMMFGAHAQVAARNLGGVFSPIQEQLLGGKEGIQARLSQNAAQFASGPMSYMLGAAMTAGPGGQIGLDTNRMQEVLRGGTSLTGLMGQSQQNIMKIAQQMSRQQGRSVQDVIVELMQRMPEMQSIASQQLGPQGMQDLQMQTMLSMSKRMGMRTAAQLVAGGDSQQANLLMGMAQSPEYYERRKAQLLDQLKDIRAEGRQNAEQHKVEREQWQEQFTVWGRTKRGLGKVGEFFADTSTQKFIEKATRNEAEGMVEEEIEAQGGAYVPRAIRGANRKIVDEMRSSMEADRKLRGGADLTTRGGMNEYQKTLARMQQRGPRTMDEMETRRDAARELLGKSYWTQVSGAKNLSYYTRRMEEPVRQIDEAIENIFQQTLKDASNIEAVKDMGSKEFAQVSQQLMKEFEKGGIPGKATLTSLIRSAIMPLAERAGRDGKQLPTAKIKEKMKQELLNRGIRPDIVDRTFEENAPFWDKFIPLTIKTVGSPGAKAALSKTAEGADVIVHDSIESLQADMAAADASYKKTLGNLGIIEDSDQVSDEEKAMMDSFKNLDAKTQALVSAMAYGHGGEGGDDVETTKARREASGMEIDAATSLEGAKRLDAARAFLEKHGDVGKRVGKFAAARVARAGGVFSEKSLEEGFRQMRAGKGQFKDVAAGERARARAEQAGYTIDTSGHVIAAGAGAAAGAGTGDQEDQIKKQLTTLDEMKNAFVGPGSASEALKIAATEISKAAQSWRKGPKEVHDEDNKPSASFLPFW